MKKTDKFILNSFIGPFAAILCVVIFILMMQILWLYIDELVGKGLTLKIIGKFIFWGGCTVLPMALPLTTLLASMMTMGQMGENNELLAFKAAGVSITRLLAPLIAASAIICVITFYANNNLVPFSYNKLYTLHDDIGRTKEEIHIPAGVFYDGLDGYTLRVEETDNNNDVMRGIMVYDHTARNGNTSLTLAESATMSMSKNKDYLIFTLENGTNYQETNVRNYSETSYQINKTSFSHQELIIPLKDYGFHESEEMRFSDQVKTQQMSVLKHNKDSLTAELADILHLQYNKFLRSDNLQRREQLDSNYLNLGKSTLESDNFLVWRDEVTESMALDLAINRADAAASELTSFDRESYDRAFTLRYTKLEILRKFASALSCFILFFIGAPIGALIKKGGLGTSAIVSVLFFLLYYIIDIIGMKLAKDGAASSVLGAFAAPAVLLPIGLFLSWKATHDSTLFGSDSFKTEWRHFKSTVSGIFHKPRIVFMGTPEFAVASLDALIQKKYKVVGVVTVADKPSGRGLQVNESAVKKYAVEHGIPVLQPVKLKDPEFLETLRAWKGDLFVVVAFRMLPEEVWAMPRLGTFNLHAALLPQYRGAAPINWAVINGENLTGVTTFMLDKNIDTGGIILREDHRIGPDDTAGDVHDALMVKGADLVLQTVQGIIDRNIETRIQESFIQGSEVLKPAPKLTKETCRIDWRNSSKSIRNLIRGLSPYPAAFTELIPVEDGDTETRLSMKIYFADYAESDGLHHEPGTILSDGKTYLGIATSNGVLKIKDLQLSGKKRMDVKTFLLGFRDPESFRAV